MFFCLAVINLELIDMVAHHGLIINIMIIVEYFLIILLLLLLLLFTLFIGLCYRALSSASREWTLSDVLGVGGAWGVMVHVSHHLMSHDIAGNFYIPCMRVERCSFLCLNGLYNYISFLVCVEFLKMKNSKISIHNIMLFMRRTMRNS